MNAGALVVLRYCAREGSFGIITIVSKTTGTLPPGCETYWVLTENGEECYTGNQLSLA